MKTLRESAAKAVLIGPLEMARGVVRERSKDRWIAIDGGVDRCLELGRVPDFAVGDWDSLGDTRALVGVPHLTLEPSKDRSDYFHALLAAVEMGYRFVEAHGLTGGRPDHHWAVIAESANAVASGRLEQIHLIGLDAEYYVMSGELPLSLKRGTTVSVFAMNGSAEGVSLTGLKYPLKSAQLSPSSRGLSNQSLRERVMIRCARGTLLVIVSRA